MLGRFLLRRFSGQEESEEGGVYKNVEALIFDPTRDTVEVWHNEEWEAIKPVTTVSAQADLPLSDLRCTAQEMELYFSKPVRVVHKVEYEEVEIIPS